MAHLVAAVAYEGLCTFEFGCVVELFALERPELGVPWYRFAVCAAERGPLRAAGGIRVSAPHSLALLKRADTIVVPGWRDADEPPPASSTAAPPPRTGATSSASRSATPGSRSCPTRSTSTRGRC